MPQIGPIPAEIAIIADFPDSRGSGFGTVGEILSRLGIVSSSCWFTTITEIAPPEEDIDNWISDRKTCPGVGWVFRNGVWISPQLVEGAERLERRLAEVAPKLVIGLGKAPLALLTGREAIAKWRGSRMSVPNQPWTFIPTIHPRTLVKQPDQRFILQNDLKRAFNLYTGTQVPRLYNFTIQPELSQVLDCLTNLLELADSGEIKLSGDLETRAGHIACFGIAWDADNALCIPFLKIDPTNPFYWSEEDEALIVYAIARLFHHPNILWIGQNYSYDCQYFWRHWGILPLRVRDTMIGAHALHSNIRKGLDFLSSLYAQDHIYWKDEIKEWDPKIGEQQYWTYNCKDACITFEIDGEIVYDALERGSMQHFNFQQSLFFPVLRMMNRGIKLDTALRGVSTGKLHPTQDRITYTGLKEELLNVQFDRQKNLDYAVGHNLNVNSPAQLKKFFYEDLGIPGITNFATGSLTSDSAAMALIATREPMLKPVCQLVVELRSVGVFLGTFIDAGLDTDGRMRCSFSIAGPTTYRFASRENAFGSGMNLQNIPVVEKVKIKDPNYIKLPNIRKLFIPDEGYTFFDIDLDRADLQVVVWEAGDNDLKKALRLGLDMHCMNACDIFDIRGIPYEELQESHPNYKDHRARIGEANRGKAKAGVHATNYGVGDRKLAMALGITVAEASRFRARWFGAHPGIRNWHVRVETSVAQKGYLENPFGARLYNFGRFNLPEFLGWGPQSTVAGVINRALVKIDAAAEAGETSIQLLIQVHDSLAGQFLSSRTDEEKANLIRLATVPVPYDDPLIIPVGVKTSNKSWGDCK